MHFKWTKKKKKKKNVSNLGAWYVLQFRIFSIKRRASNKRRVLQGGVLNKPPKYLLDI